MLSIEDLERLSGKLAKARGLSEVSADRARARGERRAQGAYFTPWPLVEFVVESALSARFAARFSGWRRDGSPDLVVLDPAAGDGRFLVAATDYLAARAGENGHDVSVARSAIVRRCAVGVERDSEFAAVARRRLGEGAVVHCAEALVDSPVEPGSADVVVGNPPYVRSIRLGASDDELRSALRGRYAATSYGEWDLYAAFIEQSLEWVRPGGEIGLVVPSRWLTARFATRLRDKLAGAAAVRAIVDFGAEQIFEGATTYASVVFLSRTPRQTVAVARRDEGSWHVGDVPAAALGAEPWRLSVGSRRTIIERLGRAGPPLGQVARIVKGAGTNADSVFVLPSSLELEDEIVRPCLRGRDVRAFGAVDPSVRCLVPYRRDGSLIEPSELYQRFPLAARYLHAHRGVLDARERGRFRGDTFYRFGRPQNMAFLGSRAAKVVVPDVARGGRALLDTTGAMVLDSAYAIRLLETAGDFTLELVLAVLNSAAVELWLRETGVPLRGGYMRMKTAYLQSLPVPAPSCHTRAVEEEVRGKEPDLERMVELLSRAYDVPLPAPTA